MVGVIFDMDGVLVASGPAHLASWQAMARRHGLTISEEQFRSTFGKPSREIIRELWGETMSDTEARALDDEKERIYRELIRGMVPLMIGVRETLARLRAAGNLLALATSGPPENIQAVLGDTGLRDNFAATVTGMDIVRGKPAPDCFVLAAARLQLRPEQCVVVEDAPVGVQAARSAGMACIGLTGTQDADRLRAEGANVVVSRLSEVTPELCESLIAGDQG